MKNLRTRGIGNGFESLEDRRLMAVTAEVVDGTLVITGDEQANHVAIERREYREAVTGYFGQVLRYEQVDDLLILADSTYQRFAAGEVKQIRVDLKGGDDTVSYSGSDRGPAGSSGLDKSASFSLGEGNDHCRLAFGCIDRSNVSIEVTAGGGDDTLAARLANNFYGTLTVAAAMGSGNDTASVEFAGELNGSATFRLLGEEGHDDLQILAEETYQPYYSGVNVGWYSTLNAELSGGAGNDRLGFAYQGILNGCVQLQIAGGAGRDQAWSDLHLDSPSTGSLHAKVWDGDSDDWFDLRLNNLSSRAEVEVDVISYQLSRHSTLPQPQKMAPVRPAANPAVTAVSPRIPSLFTLARLPSVASR